MISGGARRAERSRAARDGRAATETAMTRAAHKGRPPRDSDDASSAAAVIKMVGGGAYHTPRQDTEDDLGTGPQAYGVRLTVETQSRDAQEFDET